MTEDDRASVRYLLADEQSLFREAVRVVLESEIDLCVVAEARDGIQALAEAERIRPDVVVLDAVLPNTDGIQTTYLLRERVPECRVLVLGDEESNSEILMSALEAGATGYLTRDSPLSDLIEATRAVHRGETLIPPRMLGPLLAGLVRRRREQASAIRRIGLLTRREREVLALLADGAGNDSIAQSLVISPETARTHIQNVLAKLSVHSRLEAAAFVVQNGLMYELVWSSLVNTDLRTGKPLRHPGVWLRQAGKENAVLNPASGTVHMLNESAFAIWHLCDGKTSPEEMVEAICDVSHMPEDVVAEDVVRILGEFEVAGIVEWRDG